MPWGWGELTDRHEEPALGAVPPRLGARPLPGRHRAARGRATRRPPTARSTSCFDQQQLDDGSFPQNTQVDGTPKWTAIQMDQVGAADRARLAARALRRRPTGATSAGPPTASSRNGPGLRAGALGEPGGLLAGDDRGRDRRARLRGRHRAPQRRTARAARYERDGRRAGPATSSAGRRPPTARYSPRAVLPARDQGPRARHAAPRTRSATPARRGRPAPGRRPELPRARPARRQARRRPGDPQHARRSSTSGCGRDAERPFWHRFSLRRLRRAPRRRGRGGSSTDDSRRTLGRAWPIFAGERGEYELLAGRRADALAGGDGRRRQRRRDAPRAGLGRPRRPASRFRRARGPSRRRRWRGRTRSSSGSPGRSRRALRSSARRSWPTGTYGRCHVAALSFLADLAPVRGFPLPGAS